MRGILLPETQAIDWRGIVFGESGYSFSDKGHLLHVGTAVRTGGQVESDANCREQGRLAFEIQGCLCCHLATGESTVNPLRWVVFHRWYPRLEWSHP